jgi:chemotaxis protein methyltransferase CheR
LKAEVRRNVGVQHINLFQPQYPLPKGLDVIFCRNVMIYFDAPSREQLVGRLTEHLAPGGYLFVGHAESLMGLRHALKSVWPSVYCRA